MEYIDSFTLNVHSLCVVLISHHSLRLLNTPSTSPLYLYLGLKIKDDASERDSGSTLRLKPFREHLAQQPKTIRNLRASGRPLVVLNTTYTRENKDIVCALRVGERERKC